MEVLCLLLEVRAAVLVLPSAPEPRNFAVDADPFPVEHLSHLFHNLDQQPRVDEEHRGQPPESEPREEG